MTPLPCVSFQRCFMGRESNSHSVVVFPLHQLKLITQTHLSPFPPFMCLWYLYSDIHSLLVLLNNSKVFHYFAATSFIYLGSTDKHLDCFQALVITNNTVNNLVQMSFHCASTSLASSPGSGTARLFSIEVIPVYMPFIIV